MYRGYREEENTGPTLQNDCVSWVSQYPWEVNLGGPLTDSLALSLPFGPHSWGEIRRGWLKDAQHDSCELSFIWGKTRTAAWETAPQIALRDCSKEVGGKINTIYNILEKGQFIAIKHLLYKRFSVSHQELMSSWRYLVLLYYKEMQGLGLWNQFLKTSNYLKTCFTRFPGA